MDSDNKPASDAGYQMGVTMTNKNKVQNALLAFTVAAAAGLLATAVASAIKLVKENKQVEPAREGYVKPELSYTEAEEVSSKLAVVDGLLDSQDLVDQKTGKQMLGSDLRRLFIDGDSAVNMQASGEFRVPGLAELAEQFEREVPAEATFDEWAVDNREAIITESVLFDEILLADDEPTGDAGEEK